MGPPSGSVPPAWLPQQWPRVPIAAGRRGKSDLCNHQAMVQPRVCDCLMVTQITLKTEGPHGLCLQAACQRRSIRHAARSCFILDYDAVSACHSRVLSEPCANAGTRGRGEWGHHRTWRGAADQARFRNFDVGASLAGTEPVGFRVKSGLCNHQAIVQPRFFDCLMVTQITLWG